MRMVAGRDNAMAQGTKVIVKISAPKSEFKAGEPVPINVSLANTGSTAVTLMLRSAWLHHIVVVKDSKGHTVAEAPRAAKMREGARAGRRAIQKVLPGGSTGETLNLREMYDLAPGVYTVVVQRHASEKEHLEDPSLVTSNTLQIRISR